jgi:hypothetical protein
MLPCTKQTGLVLTHLIRASPVGAGLFHCQYNIARLNFQSSELRTQAGFTVSGGTFGTCMGTLRRNGLVKVDGDQVRASETLFLS